MQMNTLAAWSTAAMQDYLKRDAMSKQKRIENK